MARKRFTYHVSLCFRNYLGEVTQRDRIASFCSVERAEDYAKHMNIHDSSEFVFYEVESG